MRGYRRLKTTGRLGCLTAVKQELTTSRLDINERKFSSTVMGAGIFSGELIIRQYLLIRLGGLNLNRALLLASHNDNKSVVFPLPREWQEIVRSHGFKVSRFRSSLLWQLYVLGALFYGIVVIVKTALVGMRTANHVDRNPKSYIYFADLGPGNLPHETNGKQSYDVISWYLQWQGRRSDVQAIHHSVANSVRKVVGDIDIVSQRGPLPVLTSFESLAKFVMWALPAIFIAAVDIIMGRWWHALLLNQAALSAQARSVSPDSLAKDYLFHNSGWIYRPLWTYEAEHRGSTISFYYYSTNCEEFKRADGYPAMPYGWKAMNWSRYLVWDDFQADFVRRAVGEDKNISVVGSIWFQSQNADIPKLSKREVAVFDITPHRASRYCTLGIETEFYVPEVANLFCVHVSNVIQRHDATMLWKRKRNIGRVAHPNYRHLADQLAESDHVVSVDPDMAANLVIESSVAVISVPYTSTALIARAMGKPSAYYDPTGKLQKDDRAAHGIPILQGETDLDAWLAHNIPTHNKKI
jgi:polysaccharide biosynthesis PFTS motif protein